MLSSSETTREALVSAVALHQSGQLDEAEAVYMRVLQADGNNPDALHYLGLVLHQRGHSLLGANLVRRAIQISPDYVEALNNLGNIYHEWGRADQAVKLYERALELQPDHADAARNVEIAKRRLERYQRSAEANRRASEREPQNVDHLYALASDYRDLGRIEDTLGTLRKALAIKPQAHGFSNLGSMLYAIGRVDEAAATYEAWLRTDPENAVAKHMLAACTHKDVPSRADDAFVSRIFDTFAERFDDVLHKLEYRAPALVGDALRRIAGEPHGDLDIVDAGCGTGLLAQHLRPYARRLVGVDLSPRMLEKAAKRSLYDETIVAELASYLRASPQAFDVIASSDTLVYFGDLRDVFAAARRALRPAGRLLFTLEHAADDDDEPAPAAGYRIDPHGRYSHTEAYVRKTLVEAGFEVSDIEEAFLRREGESYVAGLVVLARRGEATV